MIVLFLLGMLILFVKIQLEASFYIANSSNACLGKVYDRNGEVLFDINAKSSGSYPEGYFQDVGNIIGDASGQMSNTLVSRNLDLLNNYSFTAGVMNDEGKSAIYTTLDHNANRAVYDAFGNMDGCAIAYNYKTGEILVCVSKPSVDPLKGYSDLAEGSLLCKAMIKQVPGSTQKVSTLIAALEHMSLDKLMSKTFVCNGTYTNLTDEVIKCHNLYGHGEENAASAIADSCNVYFAQLVEDADLPLDDIIDSYTQMGYAVNGTDENRISINGILADTASTELTSSYDFNTQWGCIGQGKTLVSPCQLMMWQGAIANGSGKCVMPYMISYASNVNGRITNTAETEYSNIMFSATTAKNTKDILLQNGQNYTYKISGYTLGVKSGTAQVKNGDEENSLLAGFNDDENYPIAFCIVIENKDSGNVTTEQITQVMLDSLCS